MNVKQRDRYLPIILIAAGFALVYLLRLPAFAQMLGLSQAGIISPYWGRILDHSLVITISAVGLSLIYGFTGQFSLGHAGFYGIGAYVGGVLTKTYGLDMIFPALFAGTIAAALVAFVIGLPILRLRSDYLGIATLGFGIIVKVVLDNSDKFVDAMGGSRGMSGVPQLQNPWLAQFLLIGTVAVLAIFLARNLILSAQGRAFISVREDEVAADIVGINTTRFKMLTFVIGCAMAGLAGALYAHLYPFLIPNSFNFLKSLDVLLIVVLGGLGSLTGTVVTAIFWTFLQEWLRAILPESVLDWRGVVYALILIVLMIWKPEGLFGGREFTLETLLRRRRKEDKTHAAA